MLGLDGIYIFVRMPYRKVPCFRVFRLITNQKTVILLMGN